MTKKITILGAGITGVSLGSFLSDNKYDSYDISLLEKPSSVGGLAKSFKYKNNTLDYGPHKLYSQLPGIMEEFKRICGKNISKVEKKNRLRLLGKYFDFPVKIFQVILRINPFKSVALGTGFFMTNFLRFFSKRELKTYEDYFVAGFGKPAYNLLFRDYAWKVWGNPKQLCAELGRKRVPVPNILELLKGDSGKNSTGQELSAKYFYYPKYGGVGAMSENYCAHMQKNGGTVTFDTDIKEIITQNRKVVEVIYEKNKTLVHEKTDFLVSTIYLKDTLSLMVPKPPQAVLHAANSLKYRALILVFIIVKKPHVMVDNWVFFPEKKYIFNRISEHNSFSKYIVEPGTSILTAEITCDFEDELYTSADEYIYRRVMDDFEDLQLITPGDVKEFIVRKAGRVYPVYDIHYKKNLQIVLTYLDQFKNMITLGRQGLYNYNNTDHCIDMSMKAAEYIDVCLKGRKVSDHAWDDLRKYFDSYKIVD